jgi:hypothetical protein
VLVLMSVAVPETVVKNVVVGKVVVVEPIVTVLTVDV